MGLIKIISFGFKHPDPPETPPGTIIVDVRHLFRNPWRVAALRGRSGLDSAVQAEIEQTLGFQARYAHVRAQVTAPGVEVAYIGCVGGLHRSVYLAHRLGQELSVPVEHRDLARHRVLQSIAD